MRSIPLLFALLALGAAPAAAQEFVHVRIPARGELAAGDSTRRDGSRYDVWRVRGEPGSTYFIYLYTDFPAWLRMDAPDSSGCGTFWLTSEADGGGRFAAAMMFSPGTLGTYRIRVGVMCGAAAGRYELMLEEGEFPNAVPDTRVRPEDPDTAWAAATQDAVQVPAAPIRAGDIAPGDRAVPGSTDDDHRRTSTRDRANGNTGEPSLSRGADPDTIRGTDCHLLR